MGQRRVNRHPVDDATDYAAGVGGGLVRDHLEVGLLSCLSG